MKVFTLLLFLFSVSAFAESVNLIKNGDFSARNKHWRGKGGKVVRDPSKTDNFVASFPSNNTRSMTQTLRFRKMGKYKLSMKIKNSSVWVEFSRMAYGGSSSADAVEFSLSSKGGEWTEVSKTFTYDKSMKKRKIKYIRLEAMRNTVLIDDVKLEYID